MSNTEKNTNEDIGSEIKATLEGYPSIVREDGITYELKKFEGGNKEGFFFYTKAFDSYTALVGHYGEDVIVTIINRQLQFALRQKASASVPSDKDAMNRALNKGGEAVLVVDMASAKGYVPGERELSSIGGCEKRIRELVAEIKEDLRPQIAAEPEKTESIEALISTKKLLIVELRQKMQELIAKSEDVENL